MTGAGNIVAQQRRRFVHVHDENIEIAIVIEIAERHAATGMSLGNRGTRLQQFLKFTAPQIAKEDSRRLVGKLRILTLHLRKGASGDPEQVWQTIVVQICNTISPTDIPG